MKIIQVVTLISPDSAYGGPVRVAVNQSRALLDAGHEVILVAATRGFKGSLPTTFDDVPVKLFPAFHAIRPLGFSGLIAPGLRAWLRRAAVEADVVHVHLGRDLVTLPVALLAKRLGMPYVVQTHGMVTPSGHPIAPLVDRVWTLPVLKHAARVLYLTAAERTALETVSSGASNLRYLPNGVPQYPTPAPVTYQDGSVEVLFLARLHARKRPQLFVEMAKRLHSEFPHVRFVLAGPDEGEGRTVSKRISEIGLNGYLSWEGPIRPEDAATRISQCDIYVLPSVDEPFPMSVLEALSLGKPVIITDSCGLASSVELNSAGIVIDSEFDSLVAATRELLLRSDMRKEFSMNALKTARTEFAMEHVSAQLEQIYLEGALSSGKSK